MEEWAGENNNRNWGPEKQNEGKTGNDERAVEGREKNKGRGEKSGVRKK